MRPIRTQHMYSIWQIHQTQYNKHNVKLTYTRCNILPCHQSHRQTQDSSNPSDDIMHWQQCVTQCKACNKNMWVDNSLLTQSQCIAQQLIICQLSYCDKVTSLLLIVLKYMALHILGYTKQALYHKWCNQNTTHSHCDHLAQPE